MQLITGALPQSAAEPDGAAVVPMLDQLKESKLLPEVMLADTLYGSDENVQAAETHGVELAAPSRPRAGNRPRGPDARRLRRGRTDRACGSLSARTHAAGGRAGQGSGHDADRDGAGGLRDALSATRARSARLEAATTPWSSPTRPIAWLGGGGNKRPRCLRSGTRDARASSRPTAA